MTSCMPKWEIYIGFGALLFVFTAIIIIDIVARRCKPFFGTPRQEQRLFSCPRIKTIYSNKQMVLKGFVLK